MVAVANDEKIPHQGSAKGLDLDIHDEHFTSKFYGIALDNFDMILGVFFLRSLGPILWDFENLCMSFCRGDQQICWHELGSSRGVLPAPTVQSTHTTNQNMTVQLLDMFGTIFQDPQGLPPARARDHRIHLRPDTQSVVVRPYCYPQL